MLGDIGPGVFNPPSASPNSAIQSHSRDATLTATLDYTSLELDDGSTFTADPNISATILPSMGRDLAAGTGT